MKKNRIAITLGDPAGIGPEIVCKVFLDKVFVKRFDLNIVGYKNIIYSTFLNILKVKEIPELGIIEPAKSMDVSNIVGCVDKNCGKASMLFLEKACQLAKDKYIDAIVTAPINKKSINLAGYTYSGHTEFLARFFNANNYSMLLVGKKIRVIFVTTHIPFKEISKNLNVDKIYNTILNAFSFCKCFMKKNAIIGVCALNPHASDGGVFGDEEESIIKPAILRAQKDSINVIGPLASDTIFNKMLKGNFDIIVAMYHDQGMIPLKMESFGSAVNITWGLPVIRTSVDHGTAFDIAGCNIASENSLKKAIVIADKLSRYGRFVKSI